MRRSKLRTLLVVLVRHSIAFLALSAQALIACTTQYVTSPTTLLSASLTVETAVVQAANHLQVYSREAFLRAALAMSSTALIQHSWTSVFAILLTLSPTLSRSKPPRMQSTPLTCAEDFQVQKSVCLTKSRRQGIHSSHLYRFDAIIKLNILSSAF